MGDIHHDLAVADFCGVHAAGLKSAKQLPVAPERVYKVRGTLPMHCTPEVGCSAARECRAAPATSHRHPDVSIHVLCATATWKRTGGPLHCYDTSVLYCPVVT